MALLIAFALIVAHLLGYFLLLDQQQRANLTAATGPMINDFASVAREAEQAASNDERQSLLARHSSFDRRYSLTFRSRVRDRALRSDDNLQEQLSEALASADVAPRAVEASMTTGRPPMMNRVRAPPGGPLPQPGRPDAPTGDGAGGPPGAEPAPAQFLVFRDPSGQVMSPPAPDGRGPPPDGRRPPPPAGMRFGGPFFDGANIRSLVLSAQLNDGSWLNVERAWLAPPRDFLPRMLAAELLLFATILAAALFAATRITRPLDVLAASAERVGAPGVPPTLPSRGPGEIRAVVDAFNTMSQRVAALLQEKDELIGAIGHDLRTPLASLRIRAESVADRDDRAKIIETIEHMRQLLEDSLEMARLGQSLEPPRLMDASALAESLVEEYRERGAQVEFRPSARAPLMCRPILLRRQLRNLIDNAVKFSARAEVWVEVNPKAVAIIVRDDGPGIAEPDLARMLAPFVRGETSRNRQTGGAGLGLAIAARIATLEGSTLRIANAEGGGLRACVQYRLAD